MDLSAIYADYQEERGAPPFDPRLMVRVLLLGYTTGVRSSQKLEEACWDKVAFRWLAGGEAPAYRAIAKFRKRHLSALGHLFVQALGLCQAAGMVSLGQGAPWTPAMVRANASRRKAMSDARMTDKQKILAAEVSELLAEAERIDKNEDAKLRKDNKGYGLPEELARREGRLAKITEAKAAPHAPEGAAFFRMSRSTLSFAFSRRSFVNSARSAAVSGSSPLLSATPRSTLSPLTQLPGVVSLIDWFTVRQ